MSVPPPPRPLELRATSPDDAELIADLHTAAFPDEPADPEVTRHKFQHPGPLGQGTHLIATADGAAIGAASLYHAVGAAWEPDRVTFLNLAVLPTAADRATEVLRRMEQIAVADGARLLTTMTYDTDGATGGAFVARGFEHIRTSRVQDLDLARHRARLLADRESSRARLRDAGLRTCTADQCDPSVLRPQLLRLANQTGQDVPHTVRVPDMDEAAFEGWIGGPAIRTDRVWTVWDGDRVVATSFLAYPPVRGNVWTEYTACARDHRGRGIATAVKLETVGQAIELGIARIRTDNDEQNDPMLAINRRLGYAPVHRLFEWSKAVATPLS